MQILQERAVYLVEKFEVKSRETTAQRTDCVVVSLLFAKNYSGIEALILSKGEHIMHDFTRKNLEELGLEKDVIEKLIGWHTEDMDDVLGREKTLKEKLANGEKSHNTELSGELEKLRQEFADYKSAEASKAEQSAKASAVKAALKSAGIADKYLDKLLKLQDLDSIELANGNIKDANDFIQNVKSEWGDFVAVEKQKGADVSNPKKQTETAQNPEKIMEIKDPKKRQAEWEKYLDAERKE